jgi:hypothetical protein
MVVGVVVAIESWRERPRGKPATVANRDYRSALRGGRICPETGTGLGRVKLAVTRTATFVKLLVQESRGLSLLATRPPCRGRMCQSFRTESRGRSSLYENPFIKGRRVNDVVLATIDSAGARVPQQSRIIDYPRSKGP